MLVDTYILRKSLDGCYVVLCQMLHGPDYWIPASSSATVLIKMTGYVPSTACMSFHCVTLWDRFFFLGIGWDRAGCVSQPLVPQKSRMRW
ncbi:hypothetical protein E2C01_050261 [Portunus trituberculatus]|uniref:Uncharacterized protein n=1 Tax=Portunus trituberculatus TaxID=210409 RepID=A0A5B7GGU3_PORTR|nr:hypothetical protein [Portunus trituberculatus]